MYRLSNPQESSIEPPEFNHDCFFEGGVRHAVAEHDPPRLRPSLPPPGPGDVDGLVAAPTGAIGVAEDGHGADRGVVAENTVAAPRGVFTAAQCEGEDGTERNPRRVEKPETPSHALLS